MKRKHSASRATPPDPAGEMLTRLQNLVPEGQLPLLLDEMSRPLPTSFRINPLKIDPANALRDWPRRYGWEVEAIPFCPLGYRVWGGSALPSQTVEHRMGLFYIQDAASMLPPELFDLDAAAPGLTLDLAASPGGKTTHLLSRTGDRGMLIANDSSADRITALKIVLQTWGGISTVVSRFPGERFGRWFPEVFDRVLLDAPCSMQGLRVGESHPLRSITMREVSRLAERQLSLLTSALQAVQVGGQVVYSTCTLMPEEDEAVLDALLKQFPGRVEISDLSHRLPSPAPALHADGDRRFDPQLTRAARLWPHTYRTAGFFAARLVKVDSLPLPTEDAPFRPLSLTGFEPLSAADARPLTEALLDNYGFDLASFQENYDAGLLRHKTRVYAIPGLFLERFSGFPVQAAGLLAAEETPDGWQVSHEWAARFHHLFTDGWVEISEEHSQRWLAGEDLPLSSLNRNPSIAALIVRDASGRYLGRGKVVQERLRNLLPRRLL